MLVITGIDYSKPDEMYEQSKTSLKKFKGEDASCGDHMPNDVKPDIKVERDNTFVADTGDVYATRTG